MLYSNLGNSDMGGASNTQSSGSGDSNDLGRGSPISLPQSCLSHWSVKSKVLAEGLE